MIRRVRSNPEEKVVRAPRLTAAARRAAAARTSDLEEDTSAAALADTADMHEDDGDHDDQPDVTAEHSTEATGGISNANDTSDSNAPTSESDDREYSGQSGDDQPSEVEPSALGEKKEGGDDASEVQDAENEPASKDSLDTNPPVRAPLRRNSHERELPTRGSAGRNSSDRDYGNGDGDQTEGSADNDGPEDSNLSEVGRHIRSRVRVYSRRVRSEGVALAGVVELRVFYGPTEESFRISWKGSNLTFGTFERGDTADCRVTLSRDNLMRISSGKLNPQIAMCAGKVKLEGTADSFVELGMYLFNIFYQG